MSTRCQIGFYGKEEKNLKNWKVMIYQHWDGYPDHEGGVIATVVPILKDFNKNRGLMDWEYASAWLVKELKDDYLNIGISNDFHGNIDFYYAVFPDELEVYKVNMSYNKKTDFEKDFTKTKTVNLKLS